MVLTEYFFDFMINPRMFSKQEMHQLGSVFATKEDLVGLTKVFATKEDLSGLTKTFATKDDLQHLATKRELGEFRGDILTMIDNFARRTEENFQELRVLRYQINRHDGWLEKIGKKLGIELDY